MRRGDIRLWLSEEAVAGWRAAGRTTPGGQRRFSHLVIGTRVMPVAMMRLPLRQTEGFMRGKRPARAALRWGGSGGVCAG